MACVTLFSPKIKVVKIHLQEYARDEERGVLTHHTAGGTAGVDVALAGGEGGGETTAHQGVQDAVAAVRHH